MTNENSPISVQHNALQDLIENIYGLDLKSFLIDAAEIIEGRSDNEELIESLWECSLMLPMKHPA
jgi:hypothetical protein